MSIGKQNDNLVQLYMSALTFLNIIKITKAIRDILACLKMATAPPEKAKAQSPDQGDFAYEYYEFDYAQ